MTEQDYYRGLVTEAAPGTVQQPITDTGIPQESAATYGPQEPADPAPAHSHPHAQGEPADFANPANPIDSAGEGGRS
jgi:NADH-quinone oxidoreductase subunit I